MLFIFDYLTKVVVLICEFYHVLAQLISVFKSNKVTGIFALHKCAAIPLPIVPEPITTTFLISIRFKIERMFIIKKMNLVNKLPINSS